MKVVPLSLSFILLAMQAFAQPFGLEMGTKKEKLNIIKEFNPFNYEFTPEKTHPEMEFYTVLAPPESGACMLRAVGKTLRNDAFGTQAIRLFDELRSQLDATYGTSRLNSFLEGGSIWKEPRYWAMSIHKNERSHQAVWDTKTNPKLPFSLMQILLTVNALDSSDTYVSIQYRYTNFSKCDQERKKPGSSVL